MSVLQYSTLCSGNRSPSSAAVPEMLFDERTLKEADSSECESLVCLSNCVYLINSTILRERCLLPETYFKPFPVYGDVTGYIVDQSTDGGNKLSRKLNAIDSSIRQKRILKLAVVVENPEKSLTPVETFVWNFSFGAHISAQIGYPGGHMAQFVVDYKNMDVTCREFCKLFKNLQQTFKSLLPLPVGMVPSLKVAYRGDVEFSDGFVPVDEFVNPEQIGIGQVSFPFGNGFHLSHASEFSIHNERRQEIEINEDVTVQTPTQHTMELDVPMDSPVYQKTQHDSMVCEPNLVSQELEKMTPSTEISDKSPVLRQKKRTKKTKVYEFEEEKSVPKKRSARNLFTKKPIVDDEPMEFEQIRDISPVEKLAFSPKNKKVGRVSTLLRSPELEKDLESLTIEQEEKTPKKRTFGRVSKVRRAPDLEEDPENSIIEKQKKTPKKRTFGRVSTILRAQELEKDLESSITEQEKEVPKKRIFGRVPTVLRAPELEEDLESLAIEQKKKTSKKRSFGRVSTMLVGSFSEENGELIESAISEDLVTPRRRKYARVVSVSTISSSGSKTTEATIGDAQSMTSLLQNELRDSSEDEESVKDPKKKTFGKVASVLRISVNESEPKTRKYARVSSVKDF